MICWLVAMSFERQGRVSHHMGQISRRFLIRQAAATQTLFCYPTIENARNLHLTYEWSVRTKRQKKSEPLSECAKCLSGIPKSMVGTFLWVPPNGSTRQTDAIVIKWINGFCRLLWNEVRTNVPNLRKRTCGLARTQWHTTFRKKYMFPEEGARND